MLRLAGACCNFAVCSPGEPDGVEEKGAMVDILSQYSLGFSGILYGLQVALALYAIEHYLAMVLVEIWAAVQLVPALHGIMWHVGCSRPFK